MYIFNMRIIIYKMANFTDTHVVLMTIKVNETFASKLNLSKSGTPHSTTLSKREMCIYWAVMCRA